MNAILGLLRVVETWSPKTSREDYCQYRQQHESCLLLHKHHAHLHNFGLSFTHNQQMHITSNTNLPKLMVTCNSTLRFCSPKGTLLKTRLLCYRQSSMYRREVQCTFASSKHPKGIF